MPNSETRRHMEFSARKLPKEAASDLVRYPVQSVKPYVPMWAPIYVFMPKNEKFVSVKAPLDFFVPEELEKLEPLENFYVSSAISNALPFRDAARGVRSVLEWEPVLRQEP